MTDIMTMAAAFIFGFFVMFAIDMLSRLWRRSSNANIYVIPFLMLLAQRIFLPTMQPIGYIGRLDDKQQKPKYRKHR